MIRLAFLTTHLESLITMDSISIDPAQICRAFFILATAATITANSIPQLQKAWVVYGSRRLKATSTDDTSPQHCSKSQSQTFLDYVDGFQVPHSWFTSFYITSVASSIFWAFQITTRGLVFRFLATHSTQLGGTQARMTNNQVVITWAIMALQGTRRFYESISLSKPSEAKMSILAWAVGVAFYLGVGLSVWVEGARE
jgi:3-oxo-5-alpha-steroid 4-dehydrogenase 3 / polyprenol reductase